MSCYIFPCCKKFRTLNFRTPQMSENFNVRKFLPLMYKAQHFIDFPLSSLEISCHAFKIHCTIDLLFGELSAFQTLLAGEYQLMLVTHLIALGPSLRTVCPNLRLWLVQDRGQGGLGLVGRWLLISRCIYDNLESQIGNSMWIHHFTYFIEETTCWTKY